MKNVIKLLILIVIVMDSITIRIYSQESENGQVLDKIVAIVGSEIIMKSDVDGKIELLKQQNAQVNSNDPEIRKKILDGLINENLIVTKAIEDSIIVMEDEINAEWDRFKTNAVDYFGSIKRLEDVYGMSLTRLQYEYRDIAKKQLLAQKIQQKMFSFIKITPHEVEDFYNIYHDSLQQIPPQIELYHIVKNVSASLNAKEEVFELVKRVRDSIVNGGLFADYAKRYSQDPGTASEGGELGWFAKGKLLPEFEKAAFELIPGKTSMPVETPFGYHIIQTLDKNKDSVMTRHILFRVGQSENDIQKTKDFLSSLKDSVAKGSDFIELAKKYSDDNDTKGFGGALGNIPEDQLPVSFKDVILELKENEISDPLPYNVDPSKPAFHIIYKKKVIAAHTPTMAEDYKIIEQKAKVMKQMNLYNDWIQQLRSELYWEVKDE